MPTATTAITRPELGATFQEFGLAADRAGFIDVKALRPRAVAVAEGEIPVVPLEHLLGVAATPRAPGSGYSRSDFRFGTISYRCVEHGHEELLDDRTLTMYNSLIDCEMVHSQRAVDAVARTFEQQAVAALTDTAVWTGDALTTALETPWSASDTATPVADIEAARQRVISGSGLQPNCLILNRAAWWALKNCETVVDTLKHGIYTDPAVVTPAAVAQLLDLELILASRASTNLALEGQDATISPLWPDGFALLARIATSDDPGEACLGRGLFWTSDGGAVPGGDELIATVEAYREERRRGEVIRARADWAIKIIQPQAAHLLSNVTGSGE